MKLIMFLLVHLANSSSKNQDAIQVNSLNLWLPILLIDGENRSFIIHLMVGAIDFRQTSPSNTPNRMGRLGRLRGCSMSWDTALSLHAWRSEFEH